MFISFSHCCCCKTGEERKRSGDIRGIVNHSSAVTKLTRFRERLCHAISTNERLGGEECMGEREDQGEKDEKRKKVKERKRQRSRCIERKAERGEAEGRVRSSGSPTKGSTSAAF